MTYWIGVNYSSSVLQNHQFKFGTNQSLKRAIQPRRWTVVFVVQIRLFLLESHVNTLDERNELIPAEENQNPPGTTDSPPTFTEENPPIGKQLSVNLPSWQNCEIDSNTKTTLFNSEYLTNHKTEDTQPNIPSPPLSEYDDQDTHKGTNQKCRSHQSNKNKHLVVTLIYR